MRAAKPNIPVYISRLHYTTKAEDIVEYVPQKTSYTPRVQLLDSHRNVNFKARWVHRIGVCGYQWISDKTALLDSSAEDMLVLAKGVAPDGCQVVRSENDKDQARVVGELYSTRTLKWYQHTATGSTSTDACQGFFFISKLTVIKFVIPDKVNYKRHKNTLGRRSLNSDRSVEFSRFIYKILFFKVPV